jgi:cytochrome d ubiquinol oxidase subunit II
MASAIVAIFTALYPNVMVSSTSAANNLTAHNTASPAYPLKVMSVVAIILLPVVLIYQAWTYYVFRRRVSAGEFEPQAPSSTPAPSSPPVGKTASQER